MREKISRYFIKKESTYLVLALFFGVVMVFLNPPFSGVPDEGAHFLHAWGISNGNIICSPDAQINKAAYDLAGELQPVKVSDVSHKIIPLKKIREALFVKDSSEQMTFGGILCGSDPLGYIPQVAGIEIGKIFNLPVLWSFYFARLLNMLVAVFITYYAMRLLPFGKIILLVVALLPMTMQQYASLSYDALNISLIFLFTAFVLNIAARDKEKISQKEMWKLGVLSVLAANIKWGFMPVMLVLFVLPIKKFTNKKKYFLFTFGLIFLSLFVFFAAQKLFIGELGGRAGVYPQEQFRSFVSNPLAFVYMVFNTLYIGIRFFFETFLYKPGWLTESLSPLFYILVLFGMIIMVRSEKEDVTLTKKQRIIMGLTGLASFLFVFFSLYLFWTKRGETKIQGVQGRYLLSIFPLFIFSFYKSRFNFRSEWILKNMSKVIMFLVSLMFLTVFYSIWFIYYR